MDIVIRRARPEEYEELVPRQATFARQGAASGACSRRVGRKPSYWTYLGFRPVRRECVPGVATGQTLPVGALGELTARAYVGDGLLDFGEQDFYLDELKDVAKRAAAAEVLVATADGELLGGVTFAAHGNPMADVAEPGEAEIRMLAVAPRARRRGAGESLVRACLDRARREGCSHVVLSTQAAMRSAHRIYERLGFVRTPERDWNPVPDLPIGLLTYRLAL